MKLCNKFSLSYLEIIIKDKLFRVSGSQFLKWLFGPEKFTGLSRNGPLVSHPLKDPGTEYYMSPILSILAHVSPSFPDTMKLITHYFFSRYQ